MYIYKVLYQGQETLFLNVEDALIKFKNVLNATTCKIFIKDIQVGKLSLFNLALALK